MTQDLMLGHSSKLLQPTQPGVTQGNTRGQGVFPIPVRSLRSLGFLLAVALLAAAHVTPAAAQTVAEPKPDFLVRDVNPNSPRNGQAVSPRDYRLQISAFYFGAAG
jgi:hypothetical protein